MATRHPDHDLLLGLLLQIDQQWGRNEWLMEVARVHDDRDLAHETHRQQVVLKRCDAQAWALLGLRP